MDFHEELRIHLRSVSWIGVTIIVSLFVYLGIVELVRAAFKPFAGFSPTLHGQQVRFVAFGLAIVAVIVIRFLRQLMLRRLPADDRKTALHKLQRSALVTLILCEVPSILGLILFLLFGLNIDFYLLLFVSLFLLFMYFPRRSGWEEWLKE